MFFEKVGEELHGIGADDGNVVVMMSRVCDAQGGDAVNDILGDLDADLKPEDMLVGKARCKLNEETAKTTANVRPVWRISVGKVLGPVEKGGAGWVVERVVREWISVCALSVVFFLHNQRAVVCGRGRPTCGNIMADQGRAPAGHVARVFR
jgi:hypothetical protein